jgi:hypothetical protein
MTHMRTSRILQAVVAAGLTFSGIAASSGADIAVKLTGDQEVPAVATEATATGKIVVKPDKTVSGSVTTKGVEGTMAHIHLAAAGKNGPPIIALVKTSENTWSVPEGATLTDEQFQSFKAGDLYINVHSDAHKGGEIRSQLKP